MENGRGTRHRDRRRGLRVSSKKGGSSNRATPTSARKRANSLEFALSSFLYVYYLIQLHCSVLWINTFDVKSV